MFVRVQLFGILEFILLLLIYVTLRYMMLQEERSQAETEGVAA